MSKPEVDFKEIENKLIDSFLQELVKGYQSLQQVRQINPEEIDNASSSHRKFSYIASSKPVYSVEAEILSHDNFLFANEYFEMAYSQLEAEYNLKEEILGINNEKFKRFLFLAISNATFLEGNYFTPEKVAEIYWSLNDSDLYEEFTDSLLKAGENAPMQLIPQISFESLTKLN